MCNSGLQKGFICFRKYALSWCNPYVGIRIYDETLIHIYIWKAENLATYPIQVGGFSSFFDISAESQLRSCTLESMHICFNI